MELIDLARILSLVSYKDWTCNCGRDPHGGRMWIQWTFWAPNCYTGVRELQSCRKWFISKHMTRSEVVGTAFKAALSAEEHECRETFRYRGEPIFGPHINVDELVELYETKGMELLDKRKAV